MVERYKDISVWWDRTHGGEHRIHADFAVGVDEGLAEALAELFTGFDLPGPEDRRGGGLKKCHLAMSVYECEEEQEADVEFPVTVSL